MRKFLLVIWYIFLFAFFVGGTIAICWDYAKEKEFIRQQMNEHKKIEGCGDEKETY